MTKRELEAAKKVLENVMIESTAENIDYYISIDYLSFNTGADSKEYCWYLDGDGNESCISVDTLKEVEPEEVGLY